VQLGARRRQRLALERGTEHEVRRCGELDDGRRALRLEPREPHGALEAPDRVDELRTGSGAT